MVTRGRAVLLVLVGTGVVLTVVLCHLHGIDVHTLRWMGKKSIRSALMGFKATPPHPVFQGVPTIPHDTVILPHGTLVVELFNASEQPVAAKVLLDKKAILGATLPSNEWHWQSYCAWTLITPPLGKRELTVVVDGVGEVGRHEFEQNDSQTNFVQVYINKDGTGANRFGCSISVKRVIYGVM